MTPVEIINAIANHCMDFACLLIALGLCIALARKVENGGKDR